MPKYNFCTLFDSGFLLQGLTMYYSLQNVEKNFHLYIFAFDDKSAQILRKLQLTNATVIDLNDFENDELKRIKQTRTKREYYWTCTPSIILYSLEHFNLDACTYLDADLFFFDTPKTLIDELGNNSVLITEHRYDPNNSKTLKLGKYCVQFNTFKNNEDGLRALKWWKDRCNEWCSEIPEDGKFGDQKYLDDWTERFKGVHELKNLGGGVAPWNASQYQFFEKDKKIFGKVKLTGKEFPLVFYHFHKTDLYKIFGRIKIKSYRNININQNLQTYVYSSYAKALSKTEAKINEVDTNFPLRWGSSTKFILETAKESVGLLWGVFRSL